MTAFTLIVVIIFLTANLAILYLPFDKSKKAVLSLISLGVLFVFSLSHNALNYKVPVQMSEKIVLADNNVAQRSMMATFKVSEEQLNTTKKMPTPIELGVTISVILALVFTPLLLNAVKEDDMCAKKVHKIVFSLNAVACGLLLSLYYGLELTIVPWFKKTAEKPKTSPVLT